jgi:hypothetical protein
MAKGLNSTFPAAKKKLRTGFPDCWYLYRKDGEQMLFSFDDVVA